MGHQRTERRNQRRYQGRSGGYTQGRQDREDESSSRWQDREEDRSFQGQSYRSEDDDIASRSGSDFDYGSREYQGLASSRQSAHDQHQGYGSSYGSRDLDFGSSQSSSGRESTGRFFGRGPKGYKRSDERIKEDISEVLTRDADVDAHDIEIEVKDGEVTLTGFVPERRMKHQAEDLAERCMGVKDVTNNLRVRREESRSSSAPGAVGQGAGSRKSGDTSSTTNPRH